MGANIDLSQLAIRRDGPAGGAPPPAPAASRLLSRYVLPGLLLAGFAALAAYAARETLSPPRAVTVVPVIASRAAADLPADTPLFRAAGWVEPRPTPTVVTALAEGVVEELLVVEGQAVERGQVLARLVTADADLAVEAADAEVALREGELASAQAAQAAARERLRHPVHLRAELAEAEAAVARLESKQNALPNQLKAARAREAFARRDWDSGRRSAGAVADNVIARAKSEMEAAAAAVEELLARQSRLPVELAALKERRDAVAEKLRRKIDETRQAAEADAAVRVAGARLRQARSLRDAARLRRERMVVRAPSAGRVLSLVARPGTRLNGLSANSLQDSSTVVTLYDPARLQVRVDVRLEDVAKVLAGQKARVETAALPGRPLDAEVLLATSQADVQKNSLSVKVALRDPPAGLKPDMLCQVTFLSPPRQAPPSPDGGPLRLLVPRQLILGGESPAVWVADRLRGVARLQAVTLGATAGELVEVVEGLSAADKLIVGGRDGLRDGARVRVAGEDDALGIATARE